MIPILVPIPTKNGITISLDSSLVTRVSGSMKATADDATRDDLFGGGA